RRSRGARGCAKLRHARRSTDSRWRDGDRRGDPRTHERQFVSLWRLPAHRCRREAVAGSRSRGPIMKAFTFQRVAAAENAARAVAAHHGAMFLACGTPLVDLLEVEG